MNDDPKRSSETSTEHLLPLLVISMREVYLMHSNLDYVTILLKQGVPEDQVLAANNLWRRMGLTHILLGPRTYQLRVLEPS